jgi:hypothetical protein
MIRLGIAVRPCDGRRIGSIRNTSRRREGSGAVEREGLPECARPRYSCGQFEEEQVGLPTDGAQLSMSRFHQMFGNFLQNLAGMGTTVAEGICHPYRSVSGRLRQAGDEFVGVEGDAARTIGFESTKHLSYEQQLDRIREAGYAASVTTGLGDDIDALVNKSPDLVYKIQDLQRTNWRIGYSIGGGGHSNPFGNLITVNGLATSSEKIVDALAHEIGHCHPSNPNRKRDESPFDKQWRKHSGDEWIDFHVEKMMRSEADAFISVLTARSQILDNGGPDIVSDPVVRNMSPIFQRYRDNEISYEDAVQQMLPDIKEMVTAEGVKGVDNYRRFYERKYQIWMS